MTKPEEKKLEIPPMMKPIRLFNKDYAWGLAVLDLILQSFGDKLQIGIMFRNASDGPIKFIMEKFECKLGGCIKTNQEEDAFKHCVVARDCNNLFYSPLMSRISASPVPKINGTLEFTCVYGHPDWEATRRLHMKFNIMIGMTQPPQIMPSIVDHDEEELVPSIN